MYVPGGGFGRSFRRLTARTGAQSGPGGGPRFPARARRRSAIVEESPPPLSFTPAEPGSGPSRGRH